MECDWSTREHDGSEGGFRTAEASGSTDDQAYDVVEALRPPVVDVQSDRGEQTVAELADRLGGLDERGQAGSAGVGSPPGEQVAGLGGVPGARRKWRGTPPQRLRAAQR